MRIGQLIFAAACCLRLAEAIPKIVEYHWNVEEHEIAPDGFKRKMFLVNGQFPGPKIEVDHGDVVRVIVRNNLEQPTSLHWHGMFQRGTPWMDGVPGMTNCPIPAKSSYTYEFNTVSRHCIYSPTYCGSAYQFTFQFRLETGEHITGILIIRVSLPMVSCKKSSH